VSYASLSPRQKQAVDLLMSGACSTKRLQRRYAAMGKIMGVGEKVAKMHVMNAAEKYGVEYMSWCVAVRLVYLRAKELGML
jgi:DNA-binding CsgD family transcriptional regulator